MNKKKFNTGMDILLESGLHYQKEITKEQTNIWYQLLQNIDGDNFLEMIIYWIANENEFPTITDLLNVNDKFTGKDINIRLAITKSDFGRNYISKLLGTAVKNCGGFRRIGSMNEYEYDFAIKEIEKEYKELLKDERFKLLNQQKLIGK